MASAVASLATRVESGQASPALLAQLQETQTLLDVALLVREASVLDTHENYTKIIISL